MKITVRSDPHTDYVEHGFDNYANLAVWAAEQARAETKATLNRYTVVEARVTEVLEILDGMEDIVDGEHGPLPNLAMQIVTILKGRAP